MILSSKDIIIIRYIKREIMTMNIKKIKMRSNIPAEEFEIEEEYWGDIDIQNGLQNGLPEMVENGLQNGLPEVVENGLQNGVPEMVENVNDDLDNASMENNVSGDIVNNMPEYHNDYIDLTSDNEEYDM
jgi:hypothetical protein